MLPSMMLLHTFSTLAPPNQGVGGMGLVIRNAPRYWLRSVHSCSAVITCSAQDCDGCEYFLASFSPTMVMLREIASHLKKGKKKERRKSKLSKVFFSDILLYFTGRNASTEWIRWFEPHLTKLRLIRMSTSEFKQSLKKNITTASLFYQGLPSCHCTWMWWHWASLGQSKKKEETVEKKEKCVQVQECVTIALNAICRVAVEEYESGIICAMQMRGWRATHPLPESMAWTNKVLVVLLS